MVKFNVHYIQIGITHYNNISALKVRQKYGFAGYGIYVTMLQILATAPDKKLSLLDIPQLVFQLNVKEEVLRDIVELCFKIAPDNTFYSDEVNETVTSLQRKVSNLNPSAAGKASAEARKTKKLLDKINGEDTPNSQDSPDSKDREDSEDKQDSTDI